MEPIEGMVPLTMENLQQLDRQLTEYRQFGCRNCRRDWWMKVFSYKPVSQYVWTFFLFAFLFLRAHLILLNEACMDYTQYRCELKIWAKRWLHGDKRKMNSYQWALWSLHSKLNHHKTITYEATPVRQWKINIIDDVISVKNMPVVPIYE